MIFEAIQSLFLCAVIFFVNSCAIEYYATKYDHLDIEQILNNRRMVNYYAQCLLSKGPCPPQGLEFKRILPEALETNCLRCTEKQKAVTYKTIRRLKKEYPKVWSQLQEKWDPKDIYVPKFEETYKDTQFPPPSENEINLVDRFGEAASHKQTTTTIRTTTKFVTKKTKKPKYPTMTQKPKPIPYVDNTFTTLFRPRPMIHNVISSSLDNKLQGLNPYNSNVQNFSGSVGVNQVGDSNGNSSFIIVSPTNSSNILNFEQIIVNNSNVSASHNISLPFTSFLNNQSTIDSNESTIFENITDENNMFISTTTDTTSDITSSSINFTKQSENITLFPSSTIKTDPIRPTVIFHLPPSSMNNSQTFIFHRNISSIQTSSTTTTSIPSLIMNAKKSHMNRIHLSINRTSDVITQILSTFLRPETLSSPASLGDEKPHVTHNRLVNFNSNRNRLQFDPLANLVKEITNVGDSLVNTGTSLADSVFSSVRTLFTPSQRVNRANRRINT